MILLSPKQNQIASSTKRFRVINAGRRFGKTILAVEEILGVAVAKADRRIAYIAPTFQQARDIAWEHLKNRCKPITIDTNESQLKITVRTQDKGKSTITLKSWDAIESLRGQSFHFLVIDEVAMMRNFWNGWNEVLRPALTDTKGHAMFISTPKGFNHFYELYKMQETDSNYESFHATTYDNPHVDPIEIDEAKAQLPEDQFAQEYLADFRKVEGLVYKEFERQRHMFVTLPSEYNIVEKRGGIDFGHTNPSAILTVYKTRDAKYWVIDEYYERGKVTSELIQEMQSRRCASWYPDPAEPDRIEEMRRASLSVNEVSKNVTAGIGTVKKLLKQNRLFVHMNCPNLMWELETYHYKPRRADQNEPEEPVKENDHALDCLRYVLHMWENTDTLDDEDDDKVFGDYALKDI
jgi:PBSX family phage terminase large subunit